MTGYSKAAKRLLHVATPILKALSPSERLSAAQMKRFPRFVPDELRLPLGEYGRTGRNVPESEKYALHCDLRCDRASDGGRFGATSVLALTVWVNPVNGSVGGAEEYRRRVLRVCQSHRPPFRSPIEEVPDRPDHGWVGVYERILMPTTEMPEEDDELRALLSRAIAEARPVFREMGHILLECRR